MSTAPKNKPFNLLYKYELQKAGIDKVYEFVVFQGRIIVMLVLAVIIGVFVYRFPLDMALRDQENKAKANLLELNYYASPDDQKRYNEIDQRTISIKKFLNLYTRTSAISKLTPDQSQSVNSQIKFSELLDKIEKAKKEFETDIKVNSYVYEANDPLNMSLRIEGNATTYEKAEDFRTRLREEKTFIRDIVIQNLGSTKDRSPGFQLDIKLK